MNRLRSIRHVLALVLVLNALGSPMAWAHLLGGSHDGGTSMEMAPACHGDPSAPRHSEPGGLPCCDGGGCTCAAAALLVYGSAQAPRTPHPPLSAPADTSALPAHPHDDALRPPIR